jgi:hypothetical protein
MLFSAARATARRQGARQSVAVAARAQRRFATGEKRATTANKTTTTTTTKTTKKNKKNKNKNKAEEKEKSSSAKWYVAGGLLAVGVPGYAVVSALQSDPEMREQVQLDYPDFYAALDGMVPGGLEVVTYASMRAAQSDWLDAHEQPWGEGYDEDIPNVRAVVITKRGSRYTGVELCATDSTRAILQKIIPLGAQVDDEVIDVQFEEAGGTAAFGQTEVEAMVGLTDDMTPAQLAEALEFLRQQKVECDVQEATWRGKGTVGEIKAKEMAKKAHMFEMEIERIKSLM